MQKLDKSLQPDKKLAAVCGLYCASCNILIGTTEDPKRREYLAENFGRSEDDVTCYGCRSGKRSFYCSSICTMYKCAAEKGVDFCSECNEYPCETLTKFQSEMPHRIELWNSLNQIKAKGYEKWFEEMTMHYSCPDCGTINAAYDLKCRNCGKRPSCKYVEIHMDEITGYFEKTSK